MKLKKALHYSKMKGLYFSIQNVDPLLTVYFLIKQLMHYSTVCILRLFS